MNMRMTLLRCCCVVALAMISCSQAASGFQIPNGTGVPPLGAFQIDKSIETIELITGASQRLKFDYNIRELLVETPDIVSATPISANEILITGIKQGFSTVTLRDQDRNLQTIKINVSIDVRKLENAYRTHFPNSKIRVSALNNSVILSGYVARADQVSNVVAVAKDYFPVNVINELQVNGSQNIAIKVKVYEVSRTKLRQLGVDWSYFGDNFSAVSSISELIQSIAPGAATAAGDSFRAGVFNDGSRFDVFIQALEKHNLAKLLDEPVLVAQNGRPAEFLSGGEIPFQTASGLGTNSIEFRSFGTKLDLVPIIVGPGQLSLEVRAEVSDVAPDLSSNTGVPGFRVRRVNTSVRMKAGHTLALAGDYRTETQSEKQGVPWIMDNPLIGPMFRRLEEQDNETELVFLITPRFIAEVEPDRLPRLGVGQLTDSPSDRELYRDGYLEVPRCNDDCPITDSFDDSRYPSTIPVLPSNGVRQPIPIGPPAAGGVISSPPITSSFFQPTRSPEPTRPPQPTRPPEPKFETKSKTAFEHLKSAFSKKPKTPAKQAQSGLLWPSKTRNR